MTSVLNRVRTSVLEIAYEQSGPEDGVPVLLMHGFPYDPRTYDPVVPLLVAAGCRAIVPYLRGYGPTRFLAAETPRSGQQAALGNDLKELIDALGVRRPRAGRLRLGRTRRLRRRCALADKVRGLVSANGYNIQDIAASAKAGSRRSRSTGCGTSIISTPSAVAPGCTANRREFRKLLWRLWSPNWRFDDATFERTAARSTIPTSSTW